VLEYQTAVMRQDFDTADKVLPSIPKEQRTRVAHFLEKQVSSVLEPFDLEHNHDFVNILAVPRLLTLHAQWFIMILVAFVVKTIISVCVFPIRYNHRFHTPN